LSESAQSAVIQRQRKARPRQRGKVTSEEHLVTCIVSQLKWVQWEVPWGKHTPGSERGRYLKNPKIKYNIDEVLPVVLIRNPYGWMKSMCRHPYTAKWGSMQNTRSCPELKRGGEWNGVDVRFGSGETHHQSLAHMYNDWYGHYYYEKLASEGTQRSIEAPFPRLIVRFEDIIFFPLEVTKQICNCAGGVIRHREDDKDVPEVSSLSPHNKMMHFH